VGDFVLLGDFLATETALLKTQVHNHNYTVSKESYSSQRQSVFQCKLTHGTQGYYLPKPYINTLTALRGLSIVYDYKGSI